MEEELRKAIGSMAEELRLAHKELRWAAAHLANIYNAVKPVEKAPIEDDPNQQKIDFEAL